MGNQIQSSTMRCESRLYKINELNTDQSCMRSTHTKNVINESSGCKTEEECDDFTKITKDELNKICDDRKNMTVDFFNKDNIISKIKQSENNEFRNNSNYFQRMLDFYDNSRDKKIYDKTDCLCSREFDLCIINKNAQKIRQIYDEDRYDEQAHYKSIYSRNLI